MAWIETIGETVSLAVETTTGIDGFGNPIKTTEWRDVDNVVLGNVSSSDSIDALNITGKTISYMLCIPKGDQNDWEDKDVIIRGHKFRTVGLLKEYIDPPLMWNRQIGVERYE